MEGGLQCVTSDAHGLSALERRQGVSVQSLEAKTGGKPGAVFRPCLDGSLEGTAGSRSSGRDTAKEGMNLDTVREQVRLNRPMAAESVTENLFYRKGVRTFLNNVYEGDQKHILQRYQRLKERATHQDAVTIALDAAAPAFSSSSTERTPTRRHSSRDKTGEWIVSRHLNLEQLRTRLEKQTHSGAHFAPELCEACTETSREEKEEAKKNERHPHAKRRPHVVTRPVTGRRWPEQTKSLNNHIEYHATVAQSLNDATIKLPEQYDATEQGNRNEALRYAEDEMKERRRRNEKKWRDKELSECTFYPQISPTTATLFRNSVHEKGDVFHRLYTPKKMSKRKLHEKEEHEQNPLTSGLRKEHAQEGQEFLAREERESLRALCGVMTAGTPANDTFELFLHNILTSSGDNASTYVRINYQSPLAQSTQREEPGGLSTITKGGNEKQKEEQHCRLVCFDEFLARQNLHHKNRSRSVENLKKELTPSFKPEITENSVQIAKELLARAPVTKPDVCNASALSSAVKKHQSPYVDPCTFKPKITPISTSMAPRGVEDMFKDGERRHDAIRAAKNRALLKELRYPFHPSLNTGHNAHVESLLNPKNYPLYKERLQKHRERLVQIKQEEAEMKEREELNGNTFRPKTTRKPAYIGRMASSFALVRQQYGDL